MPRGRRPPRRRTAPFRRGAGRGRSSTGRRYRHCRRSNRSTGCRRRCWSAVEQRLQRRLAPLHQVEHRAPGRARAEAGQPRERLADNASISWTDRHPCVAEFVGPCSGAPFAIGRGACASSSWDRRTSRCRASTPSSRPGTRSSPSIRSRRGRPGAARASADARCTNGPSSSGSRCARRGRCATRRSRGGFGRSTRTSRVVAAYGLILPAADPGSAQGGMHQRPCVSAAALARGRADPARDPRRRRDQRRHHHADGRRARHRADAAQARARYSRQERRTSHGGNGETRRGSADRMARPPNAAEAAAGRWRDLRVARSTRPRRVSTGAGRPRRSSVRSGLSIPMPGAWFEVNGERVKLLGGWRLTPVGQPGEVLDDCAHHRLRRGSDPTAASAAGRARAMSRGELLRGFPIPRARSCRDPLAADGRI